MDCRQYAALAVLSTAIVACSSDNSDRPGAANVESALRSMDCSEYTNFADDEWPHIEETYECSVDGEAVALHDVGTNQQSVVRSLAGRYQGPADYSHCDGQPFPTGFRVVEGDGWVVVTASSDTAAEVVRLIGGTVQPAPYGGGPPISYEHPALECS